MGQDTEKRRKQEKILASVKDLSIEFTDRGIYEEVVKKISFPIYEGRNPGNVGELLLKKNSGAVVVSEEVGYGLVPVDAFEREYREVVGRICTKLASGSYKVTRVICGIGTVIKND